MNSRVHFWIVCDAVAFIRDHGTIEQKRALRSLDAAYGTRAPAKETGPRRSAVELLVGFEAWHTDKFRDLSLEFPRLPWGPKEGITGMCGHMFTAFNHFIQPFPSEKTPWPLADGYAYGISSGAGSDSIVVGGISKFLDGRVDMDHSPILDRIRPAWSKDESERRMNFSGSLRDTAFAPWTALAPFYYEKFLLDHFAPLEVRGPNTHIAGLQLLGPICHAVTDACSIQHVRPALGFGHQAWENYIQSRVYSRRIETDPSVVRAFLAEAPFSAAPAFDEGPLGGTLDARAFVHAVSLRTADRLGRSTRSTWDRLREAGEQFWKAYLTGPAMRDDSFYLYNQAVAGTVCILTRAYRDLQRVGVFDAEGRLIGPDRIPDLDLVQDDLPDFPTKRRGETNDPPPELFRRTPFTEARDLTGFAPVDQSPLPDLLERVHTVMADVSKIHRFAVDARTISRRIEAELIRQYEQASRRMGVDFSPLRVDERLPVQSDLSAHFGTGTFRLPSDEECDRPELFGEYMTALDAHAEKARILQLTQAAAALKFHRSRTRMTADGEHELDRTIHTIEAARDGDDPAAERAPFELHPIEDAEAQSRSLTGRAIDAIKGWASSLTQVPAMGLATAAAVALLLIVVYPRGGPEGIIRLSAETWNEPTTAAYRLKSLSPGPDEGAVAKKPKLATIALFSGFGQAPPQRMTEEVYAAVRPVSSMERRFDFVDPARINAAAAEGTIATTSVAEMMADLRDRLGVHTALVVTVRRSGDRFRVGADLIDTETGEVTASAQPRGAPGEELGAGVKRAVLTLFAEFDGEP